MGVWYCTRSDVTAALDVKTTARNDRQVDRCIESASRAVEGLLRRRFYPWTGTRYFNWPDLLYPTPWRLWLGRDEVISVTSVTSGGQAIAGSSYFLEPNDEGPPYTRIELDRSQSAAFGLGDIQRDIAITGVFGYSADTDPAGTLVGGINASVTSLTCSDSSLVGVGNLLLIGTERLLVTGSAWYDTGQVVDVSAMTASNNDMSITGVSGISEGEVILVDSERMLVVDVAGSTLTVKRAWDGSVLASHASAVHLYTRRTLTVTRGALGTTAATHNNGDAISKHCVPGLVRDLTVAEAINGYEQETSGYARTIGAGENVRNAGGAGLEDIRQRALDTYGRQARTATV
jgi:hypothetical protein